MRKVGRLLHVLGDVVAVSARHADVGEHDIGRHGVEPRDRLIAVAHSDDLDVFARERQLDDTLNRKAVVSQ